MSPFRHWLALVLLVLAPTAVFADEKKTPVGLEAIQADGFAMATVNFAQLWEADALKPLREALVKLPAPANSGLETICGLKNAEIERLTVYWPKLAAKGQLREPFKFVTARKAIDRDKVVTAIKAKTAAEHEDQKFGEYVGRIAGKNVVFVDRLAVIFADERTLIFTPYLQGPDVLEEVVLFLKVLDGSTPKAKTGSLAAGVAAAEKHTAVAAFALAPVRNVLIAEIDFPEAAKPFLAMARAERGLLTLDVGPALKAEIALTFSDAGSAKQAEPDAKKIVAFALETLSSVRKEKGRDDDTNAILLPLLDFAKVALDNAELKVDGKELRSVAGNSIDATIKKVLAAIPAWTAAEAQRMKMLNNLKQLALAMHNYIDVHGHCPADILDKNGKAILSWRVELLPYIEQDALYKMIDRTKPWDDEANKKIAEQLPDMFVHFGREAKDKGSTYFQCFTAPKALQSGNPFLVPGRKLHFPAGFTDGISNSFMVVEGETAVNWLKPGDIAYDPKKPPKVGDPKTGKFAASMCDGSVRWLNAKQLGEKKLHALITVDGGEVVSIDE